MPLVSELLSSFVCGSNADFLVRVTLEKVILRVACTVWGKAEADMS